ncbi:MAG: C40 family peptidase [Schaedlerella sp.]|nr:C40 family peptidase [Schaedlerella sp.]
MDRTQKKRKLLISAIAGMMMISGSTVSVNAAEGEYLNRAPSNVSDAAYIRTAPDKISERTGKKATVIADVLNVRSGQGTEHLILTQILQEQTYEITGEPVNEWYPVRVGQIDGWVCGEYILIETDFSHTESEKEQKTAEVNYIPVQDNMGQAVIDFACQFIGNPYVWGGTSLTEGADCSGFVQSVYANFGISLPRTTWEMCNSGYEVSYEEAALGDLILYDGHVGLYMGDGTIVNAMNEADGIGICSATYAPIVAVRRVL